MRLLHLPVEVFHGILFFAVLSRGVTRALRLKLVCRAFYNGLNRALFQTQLLDHFAGRPFRDNPCLMTHWRIRDLHGAEKFWHSYLRYRVLNESNPDVGWYSHFRLITRKFCSRAGTDYVSTVDALCWLTLERVNVKPGGLAHDFSPDKFPDTHYASWLYPELLSAAAHLGYFQLARELLDEGHSPTEHNQLFPAAMFLAAYAGHFEIVMLFQIHLLKRNESDNGIGIDGALARGDIDMIHLFPDWADMLKRQICTERYARKPHNTGISFGWSLCTKSEKVYQYLCKEVGPLSYEMWVFSLFTHAEYGNLKMVRRFLREAGDLQYNLPYGYYDRDTNVVDLCTHLKAAAARGHEDIVDLLLAYGADKSSPYAFRRAIHAAAEVGDLAIVRKLIKRALLCEHTAMLRFLLERRTLPANRQDSLVYSTLRNGLESMADIMRDPKQNP